MLNLVPPTGQLNLQQDHVARGRSQHVTKTGRDQRAQLVELLSLPADALVNRGAVMGDGGPVTDVTGGRHGQTGGHWLTLCLEHGDQTRPVANVAVRERQFPALRGQAASPLWRSGT